MSATATKSLIIQKAKALGFSQIGFSRAEKMDPESKNLETWLNKNFHGKMGYMENHFEKRTDPTKLVPGAKTVISLSYNYYTEQKQSDSQAPKISMYAFGRDYHKVVKKKLKLLYEWMKEEIGQVHGRIFVDSAPVLERDWARRSGLGWTGKNTMLIHPKMGSYFFLAEMILDLEIDADHSIQDYCGTCTRCIDACPTEAIPESGYILDASKCISYLTIELRSEIPETFREKMENWMFGCDICQQVCPWNRFSSAHEEAEFEASDQLIGMTAEEWEELTEVSFQVLFKGSAVKRTKYSGLKRNIDFLKPRHK